MVSDLILSIKRRVFRVNDPNARRADQEFRAVRPNVLKAHGFKCHKCSLVFEKNEVHHKDDRHDDNRPEMLCPACTLCHAYHHVGETSKLGDVTAEQLGDKTLIAVIPEISAVDLNNLQRVIGIAMLNEAERPIALKILTALAKRAVPVKASWGSSSPSDFAAAMAVLSDEAYARRDEAVGDLRIVFHHKFLTNHASNLLTDRRWQAVPVSTWPTITERYEC